MLAVQNEDDSDENVISDLLSSQDLTNYIRNANRDHNSLSIQNDQFQRYIGDISVKQRRIPPKRTYNAAFLNQQKEESKEGEEKEERPLKIHKSLHEHKEMTAEECMKQNRFVQKIKVQPNTVQRWRADFAETTTKFNKLRLFVLDRKNNPNASERKLTYCERIGVIVYGSYARIAIALYNDNCSS